MAARSMTPNPSVKGTCLRQAPYIERYSPRASFRIDFKKKLPNSAKNATSVAKQPQAASLHKPEFRKPWPLFRLSGYVRSRGITPNVRQ
jgi:hypothetical protein